MEKSTFEPIAIIGYGCVYSGDITNTDKLWQTIINGNVHIGEIPKERWDADYYYSENRIDEDKTYSKLGACISNHDFSKKHPEEFLNDLKRLNRIHSISLETIMQSLKKSNYDLETLSKQKVGYLVGNMLGDDIFPDISIRIRLKEILEYMDKNEEFKKIEPQIQQKIKHQLELLLNERFEEADNETPEKYMNSTLSYLIKEIMGLKGPTAIVDGACSSGLLVIDEAIKMLKSDALDMCLVTGALGSVNVIGSVGFSKIGGLSETIGKPLEKSSDGLNSSEGVGTILIKKLDTAIRDQDKIYGVISGIGSANDGKGKSIYAPSRYGQLRAMKLAMKRANTTPENIDYIEVHATGTPTGDLEEIETLKLLFEGSNVKKQSVPIGSIKSQIGHSFSAAGMANLFKVLESMEHEIIPPTWGYVESPRETAIKDSAFYVNTDEQNWPAKFNEPRRAIVNAFGFGGINSSLVVEQYDEKYHKSCHDIDTKKVDFSNIDIAIVGIGICDSHALSLENWSAQIDNQIVPADKYPQNRWNSTMSEVFSGIIDKACFVEDMKFPWLKFKMPPKVLEQIDRAQPMALITADEAIVDYGVEKIADANASVYVGKMVNSESASMFNISVRVAEYIERLKQIENFQALSDGIQNSILESIKQGIREHTPGMTEDALPGYMDNIISGRISNFYNFTGTSVVVDSGSNSFLVALKQGIDNLMTRESNLVLIGGVSANMAPEYLETFKMYNYAKDVQTKHIYSEGAVFFVAKRFEDVSADDNVYARIKGVVNEDLEDSSYNEEYLYNAKLGLFNTKNKKNYFGAQAGFELLEAILNLQRNNFENMTQLTTIFKTGIVKIKGEALFSDNYSLYVTSAENSSRLERAAQTIYVGAQTKDELINKLSTITKANYNYYVDRNEELQLEMTVSITFESFSELFRKIQFIRL